MQTNSYSCKKLLFYIYHCGILKSSFKKAEQNSQEITKRFILLTMYMSMHCTSLKLVMPEITQRQQQRILQRSLMYLDVKKKRLMSESYFQSLLKNIRMFSLTEIRCLQSLDVFDNENIQRVYLGFQIS